jgi:hypothetical protein
MCKPRRRTFSVLPDGLLPYHFPRTARILTRLDEMVVEERPTSACAKAWNVARSTLRRLKDAFLRTVPKLRLPEHEGALGPREFLLRLADRGVEGVASLFRGWKEHEPKLAVVGIYAR